MDESMNKFLKSSIISVLACCYIILSDADLSPLKTYLTDVIHKITEKREIKIQFEKQRYATLVPNNAIIAQRDNVYKQMSAFIGNTVVSSTVASNLIVSNDTACRGSPLNRSP
jgi:hypothetical protein